MTDAERQRLIRILGMLGSEHAGERAAAALQAEAFRRKHGLTWAEMVNGKTVHHWQPRPAPQSPPQPPPQPSHPTRPAPPPQSTWWERWMTPSPFAELTWCHAIWYAAGLGIFALIAQAGAHHLY